jgi:PIN domain nuclease of toxin-antitoxin system
MIVLDTHTWLWWISNPELLSEPASQVIEKAVREKSVHISSISSWEVAMLVQKGRLQLSMDVRDWVLRSEALPFLTFLPVDNAIAVQSTRLPGELHGDPADRIIIATAQFLGAELVTKDNKIREYPYVKTVW